MVNFLHVSISYDQNQTKKPYKQLKRHKIPNNKRINLFLQMNNVYELYLGVVRSGQLKQLATACHTLAFYHRVCV